MQATSRTALRRMGNSTGMIVPKAVLAALGAEAGEPLDMGVEDGRLVVGRPGELGEAIFLTPEEARELKALAVELNAAAARMEATLDRAIAGLQEANDPKRDEVFRQRALAELRENPVDLSSLFG